MKSIIEILIPSKNKLILLVIYSSTILLLGDRIGPYEGSQIGLSLGAPFSDWWGVAAPILPQVLKFGNSNRAWIAFYTFLLAGNFIGLSRIIPTKNHSTKLILFLNFFLHYLIIVFVLVGGRDGIMLGLTIFGLGLTTDSMSKHKYRKFLEKIIGWLLILVAAQFKLPGLTSIVVSIAIFGIIMRAHISKKIAVGFLGVLIIPVSLFFASQIREYFFFDNTFPEQQVMFNDIAGIYCWSPSEGARDAAGEALSIFQRQSVSGRELCASMVPYGWDNLRLPWIEWEKNIPIIQITKNDESSFNILKKNWLEIIQDYPTEWIAFKVNLMGQVLFMSHSYEPLREYISQSEEKPQFLSRSIFLSPILILDSIYGLSFLFSFLISIVLMLRTRIIKLHLGLLFFLLAGFVTILITYVANNGRYVAPYTLLFFVMQLRILQDSHKPQRFLESGQNHTL